MPAHTHKELLEDCLFFCNAYYHPRVGQERYGSSESIPLPAFNDPSWALPDIDTTGNFGLGCALIFLQSMRPSTGSKQTHLQWWMPTHVPPNIHKTTTLFVFRDVSEKLLSSLMDCGCDTKVTIEDDIIVFGK